jgi:hypothetical protein
MPEKDRPFDGDVRELDGPGGKFVDECGAGLRKEEVGIVRVKRVVEVVLDRWKIDGLVFDSEVIAVDEQRSEREE